MSEIKIGEQFIISDIEVVENLINFELTILPDGETFVEEQIKKNKDWTLENYFKNFIETAIKTYIEDVKSKQATD